MTFHGRRFVAAGTVAVGALSMCAVAPAVSAQQPDQVVRAITGATLIDGTGALPLADAVLVLNGDRIACVGHAGDCVVPEGARIIDGTGRWIIPGLIDTHFHLFWRPDPDDLAPLAAGRNGERLTRQLAQGVTTIREASTHSAELQTLALRDASHVPEIPWPRIYVSGRVDDRAIERHRTAGAGELTARLIEMGVDGIKIRNGLTLDDVIATVGAARPHDIPVYGHAGNFDEWGRPIYTMDDAVLAGISGKVHLDFDAPADLNANLPAPVEPWADHNQMEWLRALSDRWLYGDPALQSERIRLMVERGVWIEPTLGVVGIVRLFSLREPTPEQLEADARVRRAIHAFLREFYGAGGIILAGTDSPVWGLHAELEALVEAGLPPMAAIQAGTRNAARALGWEDRIGTIERGKLADLVLLDADPLVDIGNTARIWRVLKGGLAYDPDGLLR